jgi:short-subunit dehydrogenase
MAISSPRSGGGLQTDAGAPFTSRLASDPTVSLPAPTPDTAALVTGASSGIGAAISKELAKRGHTLILVARRKEKLDELAGELTAEFGVRAESLGCDLGKAASRQRLSARISSLGLEVSVLVNNAGFATGGPFHEADPARELEQVRVLVEAPVALSSAFLPAMVRRGKGAVLNVASTAGMQPLPYSAGYSAAKAYVLTFSEALHQELHGSGVTVTVLAPGPVSTEFWDVAGWEIGSGQSFEKAVPRPAWVTAEEAASAGVKGLEAGRRVVIPGLPVRAAMLATQYLPHAFKLPAIEWAMRRR